MEDVLETNARPRDERRPVVCADEGGKQLIGDARPPLPTRPKHPAKEDHEYVRNGTANLFLASEPLAGWRHVEVTERKTKVDFARFVRRLVTERYGAAEKVVLVLDNRATHTPLPSTRRSRRPRRDACASGSSRTTRRSTAVGST